MTSAIRDSLEILKKAQDFDRQIYDFQEELNQLPADRAVLKDELESKKRHLHELQDTLKKLQLGQKEKEGKLSDKEANIKKMEGQLSQVKTNKEYSALQQEIASLKADNSLLEEEIIKTIDEVEAAEDEIHKEKDRFKEVEKEYASKELVLTDREKELKHTIDEAKKSRQSIMGQVDLKIREQYELIVEKKRGIALSRIHGETCGACQMLLRAQVLNEVRMGDRLILCETCSRILYEETSA